MRNKKASIIQIGIDIDTAVIERWKPKRNSICELINDDAISALQTLALDDDTVIYADPPYLPMTRRRLKVYKHDYSESDHAIFLDYIRSTPCKIIISGYYSDLYSNMLKGWNVHKFKSKTHTELREEYIWYNFEKPTRLHDYSYVGVNFREREKIKRKRERIITKLKSMSLIEVNALMAQLKEEFIPSTEC